MKEQLKTKLNQGYIIKIRHEDGESFETIVFNGKNKNIFLLDFEGNNEEIKQDFFKCFEKVIDHTFFNLKNFKLYFYKENQNLKKIFIIFQS